MPSIATGLPTKIRLNPLNLSLFHRFQIILPAFSGEIFSGFFFPVSGYKAVLTLPRNGFVRRHFGHILEAAAYS